MQGEAAEAMSTSMATCLSETGCLIVRDPRVGKSDNETFLDLMESYFEQPDEVKLRDARPELHYQVYTSPAPNLLLYTKHHLKPISLEELSMDNTHVIEGRQSGIMQGQASHC